MIFNVPPLSLPNDFFAHFVLSGLQTWQYPVRSFHFTFQGQFAEAGALYASALEIWKKVLGPEHPNVATANNNRAAVLGRQVRIEGSFGGNGRGRRSFRILLWGRESRSCFGLGRGFFSPPYVVFLSHFVCSREATPRLRDCSSVLRSYMRRRWARSIPRSPRT